MTRAGNNSTPDSLAQPEVIDAAQLAERWRVSRKWVHNHTRQGYDADPIPCVKLGRYVRFEWGSQILAEWWARRRQ